LKDVQVGFYLVVKVNCIVHLTWKYCIVFLWINSLLILDHTWSHRSRPGIAAGSIDGSGRVALKLMSCWVFPLGETWKQRKVTGIENGLWFLHNNKIYIIFTQHIHMGWDSCSRFHSHGSHSMWVCCINIIFHREHEAAFLDKDPLHFS